MTDRHTLATAIARAVLLAAILACLAGPWILDRTQMSVLTEFFTLLVMALMWNLLAGYADIITVGQHAYVGIGAYVFFGLTVLAKIDVVWAIPLTALLTLLLALPSMIVVFRLRAAYLAVGTWVLAEVAMLIAGKLPGFGGGSGISVPIPIVKAFGASQGTRIEVFYWMALGLAFAAFAATWALLRSRIGLGLTAIRDNEESAGSSGVDLVRVRAVCFLWTAPFLGLAGVLATLQKLRVAPSASFNIADWTIFIIFAVVIGGIGSLEGPIIGTALYIVLREYLSGYGTWYLIFLGLLSIGVVIWEPRGLWGLVRRLGVGELIRVPHATPPHLLAMRGRDPEPAGEPADPASAGQHR
jgi:branched-chain amino acid transport system permease protein